MLPISWVSMEPRDDNWRRSVSDATSPVPVSLKAGAMGNVASGADRSRALARAEMGEQRPRRVPVECGDLPFLIKRDGTWLYRGSPIGRKELVCLFASVLKRDAEGGFWLETSAERGRIEVEDAPFVAVELDWTGVGRDQVLTFRTNTDQLVT